MSARALLTVARDAPAALVELMVRHADSLGAPGIAQVPAAVPVTPRAVRGEPVERAAVLVRYCREQDVLVRIARTDRRIPVLSSVLCHPLASVEARLMAATKMIGSDPSLSGFVEALQTRSMEEVVEICCADSVRHVVPERMLFDALGTVPIEFFDSRFPHLLIPAAMDAARVGDRHRLDAALAAAVARFGAADTVTQLVSLPVRWSADGEMLGVFHRHGVLVAALPAFASWDSLRSRSLTLDPLLLDAVVAAASFPDVEVAAAVLVIAGAHERVVPFDFPADVWRRIALFLTSQAWRAASTGTKDAAVALAVSLADEFGDTRHLSSTLIELAAADISLSDLSADVVASHIASRVGSCSVTPAWPVLSRLLALPGIHVTRLSWECERLLADTSLPAAHRYEILERFPALTLSWVSGFHALGPVPVEEREAFVVQAPDLVRFRLVDVFPALVGTAQFEDVLWSHPKGLVAFRTLETSLSSVSPLLFDARSALWKLLRRHLGDNLGLWDQVLARLGSWPGSLESLTVTARAVRR